MIIKIYEIIYNTRAAEDSFSVSGIFYVLSTIGELIFLRNLFIPEKGPQRIEYPLDIPAEGSVFQDSKYAIEKTPKTGSK